MILSTQAFYERWCVERGLVRRNGKIGFQDDSHEARFSMVLPDKALEIVGLTNVLSTALDGGEHPRTLLWLSDWGMWSESIDDVGSLLWKHLAAAEGIGDASVEAARGLLFDVNEATSQRAFLTIAIVFQWDALLVPEHGEYVVTVNHHLRLDVICRADARAARIEETLRAWV